MPTLPLLLLLILSFSTTTTATHNRRILHQPLFPSTPPAQPPSPPPQTTTPNPKLPFSTSTPTTPPFFPSLPSAPSPPSGPSPPSSPSSFASFPANISSLILPHSPSSSKPLSSKLAAVAAVLTVSAFIVTAISLFLYLRRRRRQNPTDNKSSISDITHVNTANALSVSNVLPKQRRSPPTNHSSEFLYLGNIATSRGGASGGGGGGGGDASLRKLDSPELRPLPPLRQQSINQNYANAADVGSEDEEFYSPRESSGSTGTGSASRREFAAAAAAVPGINIEVRCRTGSSSSLYSSSSNSGGSPPISSSPPVSSSPINSMPVITQLAEVKSSPSLSPPSSSSPERGFSERSLDSSPGITYDVVQIEERISPIHKGNSLSLSLPERFVEKTHDLLARMSLVSNRNVESLVRTGSANSNQLGNEKNSGSPSLSPRISNVSNLNVESPSLSSPERLVEKTHDLFTRIPVVSNRNVESLVRSSSANSNQLGNGKNSGSPSPSLSSSEGHLEKTHDLSPRISNVSSHNCESPVRSSSAVLDQLSNKKSSRSPSLSSSSPRISNVSNCNGESPLRSSSAVLDQLSNKKSSRSPSVSSSSPRISNASIRNGESPLRSSSAIVLDHLGSRKSSRSPSLSSLSSSSPERSTEISYFSNPGVGYPGKTSSGNLNGLANKNSRSPSVSSLSSSPERHLEKTHDSSSGISHVSKPKVGSSAGISNAIPPRPRRQWEIPVSPDSSPLEKTHDLSSPGMSNVLNQNLENLANQKHSRSPSWSSLSSPQRPLEKTQESPARSSPQRPLEKTQESPARISNGSNPNAGSPARVIKFTPPPPPPPPPPPLPLSRRHWEIPFSSQSVPPVILKPPDLVTAPRPVTIPTPTLISPIELPPNSENAEEDEETEKPKLKPLHWDKVRASSDREMVWDQLKSSSFRLNEEMIETLFVVNKPSSIHKEATRRYVLPSPSQENRVLDPKKAQNIAIALRALNVTIEEVCEALSEGNVEALGTELLESLLKMAPTKEEEYRLKEYKDDSPFKLGPAEKFLKAVLDIPYAFKRADAMLYIANFETEVDYLKKSFETLEVACEELRNSRMFLKLLEAVLKTGNRMNVGTNRGDAHAFKLDTLLKLVDVKGADGKTTLLHFVVQEIIRSEGARLSSGDQNPSSSINDEAKCRKLGLQVVSALSSELKNVKKSAAMDSDVLSSDVLKLFKGLENIAETVRLNEEMGLEESIRKFSESMKRFVKMAEEEIIRIQAQESVALSLVKEITEYFHGNSAKEEAHPFRIFTVVRDFLTILDRVCKEVGMINERTIVSSAHKFPVPVNPMMQPLISGSGMRQYSFSDDESSSP